MQTAYRYTGQRIQKPTTQRLKFGAARYAQRVGDYMVQRQAHSYDEIDAPVFRTVEITRIASGKAEITTIEMDEETCAYFACTYRIGAGE